MIKTLAFLALFNGFLVAKESPEEIAKHELIRAELPLGGNFSPKQEEGIFVAAGHGLNVVVSRDDGETWTQSFKGRPGGDHGYWSVWNNIAYTEGVFAIACGWGAPGTIIASDDGVNWRHLSSGKTPVGRKGSKVYDMKTTMQFIGVEGSFIMPLCSTADFGDHWLSHSAYGWKDDNGKNIKVDVSHPSVAFGDGRVLVLGGSGPSIYSDDLGKTWKSLNVEIEGWGNSFSKGFVFHNGAFLVLRDGKSIFRSVDKGLTWKAHVLGIEKPAGRSFCLSVVGDEVWATGKTSKKSKDGITWEPVSSIDLSGQIAMSDKGTLISVSRKRLNILRSIDGGDTWSEVYSYTSNAKGGAQGLSDVVFGKVARDIKK